MKIETIDEIMARQLSESVAVNSPHIMAVCRGKALCLSGQCHPKLVTKFLNLMIGKIIDDDYETEILSTHQQPNGNWGIVTDITCEKSYFSPDELLEDLMDVIMSCALGAMGADEETVPVWGSNFLDQWLGDPVNQQKVFTCLLAGGLDRQLKKQLQYDDGSATIKPTKAEQKILDDYFRLNGGSAGTA